MAAKSIAIQRMLFAASSAHRSPLFNRFGGKKSARLAGPMPAVRARDSCDLPVANLLQTRVVPAADFSCAKISPTKGICVLMPVELTVSRDSCRSDSFIGGR